MDKTYHPNTLERPCYQAWENSDYFNPMRQASGKTQKSQQKPYCIMLPPPNVTGRLHMGHGFQITLMDILIRYHRMQGDKTLWQMGTDHAGIATQMVVERQLKNSEGQPISRLDIGRAAFTQEVYKWTNSSGNFICQQIRRLGASVYWPAQRFTMDAGFCSAVQRVFIHLHQEGLIYRDKKLVNWDPKLCTAISDLEVINREETGKLYYIKYPLVNKDSFITVATTRPETLLGDVACAVHPDDERYQHLIGHKVKLPLTDREIPIIADKAVISTFGTGCVKITPAHDFNDYAVGKRHGLPCINILTPHATLNDEAPSPYQGLDRFVARQRMVDDLKTLRLLEKIEEHTMSIPYGDRSNSVIEPYLTDQWFIKTKPLAEPAIEAVKSGKIKFHPSNWEHTYFQWLENIEDWCISRQLWWGHRIPAWFDENGNVYVGTDEASVRKANNLSNNITLRQEDSVLDTWFSSALWPFATLGWPDKTDQLKTFYPTQVLVTGFDIIFFWVARMIMMALKFTGDVPFQDVYITGLVRDTDGKKMSKSKGNILDPIDLIDGISLEALVKKRTLHLMQPQQAKKVEAQTRQAFPQGIKSYGTDALRFTYCALASTGRDIRFDMERLNGYRNFCNKLWNAARYVIMRVEALPPSNKKHLLSPKSFNKLNLIDRWILSALQNTIDDTHKAITNYRFDQLAKQLHEFTWHHYCDWYLELTKSLLPTEQDSDAQALTDTQIGTYFTLIYVLDNLLRLLHPIIPYITEAIWQKLRPWLTYLTDPTITSLMVAPFPTKNRDYLDAEAEAEIQWIQAVVTSIRTLRSEMNIKPNQTIPLLLQKGSSLDKSRIKRHKTLLYDLMRLNQLAWLTESNCHESAPYATAIVDNLLLCIPMKGLINKEAELNRLNKAIQKLEKKQTSCQQRLNNPNYVAHAPQDVVKKEQDQLAQIKETLKKYQTYRTEIEKI